MRALINRRFFSLEVALFAIAIFAVLFGQGFLSLVTVEGQSGSPRPLSGYAWDSNMGWISFRGVGYGVESFGDDLQGYAWSSNAGWIRFDKGVLGVPPGGGASGVKLTGNQVTGWARACLVFENGCSGILRPSSETGGWDGWISMSGGTYGVTYDSNTGQFANFAWGDTNLGWIDFCPDPATGACVTLDSLSVSCTANGGVSTVDINTSVTWQGAATGGTGSYTYCWGTNCADSRVTGDVNDGPDSVGTVTVSGGYSPTQTVTANVLAIDSDGKDGIGVCSIDVEDQANPTLTVNVVGGDKGSVTADKIGNNSTPPGWTTGGCVDSCDSSYPLNEHVILTAMPELNTIPDPDEPYEFTWSEPSCVPNTLSCGVDVTAGGKYVTVTFKDQTIVEQQVNLIATPGILEIYSHNAGQPASTRVVTINASSAGDLTGSRLCLESFIGSDSLGTSIDNIVSSPDKLQCILGNLPQDCAKGGVIQCATLSDTGSGYKTTFQVSVPTKLNVIRDYSPYSIKLVIQTPGLTGEIEIPFKYNTGDVGP